MNLREFAEVVDDDPSSVLDILVHEGLGDDYPGAELPEDVEQHLFDYYDMLWASSTLELLQPLDPCPPQILSAAASSWAGDTGFTGAKLHAYFASKIGYHEPYPLDGKPSRWKIFLHFINQLDAEMTLWTLMELCQLPVTEFWHGAPDPTERTLLLRQYLGAQLDRDVLEKRAPITDIPVSLPFRVPPTKAKLEEAIHEPAPPPAANASSGDAAALADEVDAVLAKEREPVPAEPAVPFSTFLPYPVALAVRKYRMTEEPSERLLEGLRSFENLRLCGVGCSAAPRPQAQPAVARAAEMGGRAVGARTLPGPLARRST